MSHLQNNIVTTTIPYNSKLYYQKDLLNNVQVPSVIDVIDVIEETKDTNVSELDDVSTYQKLGKIFENNHLYNEAINLYNKSLSLIDLNSQLNKTEAENEYKSLYEDLCRAIDKNNNQSQSLNIRG